MLFKKSKDYKRICHKTGAVSIHEINAYNWLANANIDKKLLNV
jgi:hypothetical protein